jgi:hypothetical protein
MDKFADVLFNAIEIVYKCIKSITLIVEIEQAVKKMNDR